MKNTLSISDIRSNLKFFAPLLTTNLYRQYAVCLYAAHFGADNVTAIAREARLPVNTVTRILGQYADQWTFTSKAAGIRYLRTWASQFVMALVGGTAVGGNVRSIAGARRARVAA
jgi:hypothetical protein